MLQRRCLMMKYQNLVFFSISGGMIGGYGYLFGSDSVSLASFLLFVALGGFIAGSVQIFYDRKKLSSREKFLWLPGGGLIALVAIFLVLVIFIIFITALISYNLCRAFGCI